MTMVKAKLAAKAAAVGGSLLLLSTTAMSQQAGQAPAVTPAQPAAPGPAAVADIVVPIGYVELMPDADARWDPLRARFEVPVRPWGSSYAGAVMGVNDNAPTAKFTHIQYALNRATANSVDDLITAVKGMVQAGAHFV